MPRDIRKYLLDIQVSIESIQSYLGPERDFSRYESSKMTRRAVERELEIIGEAMSGILRLNPDISISSARRIVNLRNLVIHGYDNVDNMIIWGILSRDIPQLHGEVTRLLSQSD